MAGHPGPFPSGGAAVRGRLGTGPTDAGRAQRWFPVHARLSAGRFPAGRPPARCPAPAPGLPQPAAPRARAPGSPPEFLWNQYLRQPLDWNTLIPAPESLQNARNIFSAVQALPCSLADIDPILWDGFAPHFARFRDVHGESLEGAGSMSAPDPEAEQLPDGNRVVPAVYDWPSRLFCPVSN